MSLSVQRRNQVLTWVRESTKSIAFIIPLASGDEATRILLRIMKSVACWAIHENGALTTNNDHWAEAEKYMSLDIRAWKMALADSAVRGAWTIPLTLNKLVPIDKTTFRPTSWPKGINDPATSSCTEQEINDHVWGW